MRRCLLVPLVVAVAALVFAQDAKTAANEKVENVAAITTVENPKGQKLFVVGDSTLSAFNDPYFYPRYGYGTKLQEFLDAGKIQVVNLAMSGRSSKSFATEENYQTLKTYLKKGDYLLIGFGHNDEKNEEARFTDANGSKETPGSFKNSLYENYIKLAKEKKATPILCTPIVRRAPGKAYEGSVVHVTADQGPGYPAGDYPKAVRELAAETKTLLVDLTAKTKMLYEYLGDDQTLKLHAWIKDSAKSVDNTHLNNYGAFTIAEIVIKDVAAQNKKFKKLLKAELPVPTEDRDLVKNPHYAPPPYAPFSPEKASLNFAATAPWYGTVFGDMGGEEKAANPDFFEIIESAGKVTMHAGSKDAKQPQGKIASTSDGPLLYFQQIPSDKNFTITATVKILAIAKNNQVGFGLMARDDVLIDEYDNTVSSNYVAVGGLGVATANNAFSTSWQRKDSALERTTNTASATPVAGATINLSLKKNGNTYTVKYGNEPEATYTADLTEKDKGFIYVGPFVARAAYVEFTNIRLTVQ